MKSYRNIVIALFVLLAVTVVARGVQLATRSAASESIPEAQAAISTVSGQSTSAGPGRPPETAGLPPGVAGPASELLRLMGVNKTDFGIKVVETFDASGRPAYETKGGDLLFFTNASVSYNSTADKPMVIVIPQVAFGHYNSGGKEDI